ncbi:MAG: hypothetical protein L0Y72_29230 [Gemmataceae bacterium]|nr:hypothetical protein [Gemmataceae bacterium]MCI0743131.1 hypothetical protein [Gemmataceae bacterium]
MRRVGHLLVVFTGLLLLVGWAGGQQFQFGGKGGGFGGGGAQADPVTLIRNAAVIKELDITEEQTQKIPAALTKALSGVLNDKQMKRLNQIVLQQKGMNAFLDAGVQTTLKISDDQKTNIKSILEDSAKEIAEAAKDAAAGGDFKGLQEKMAALRKEATDKVTNVLSETQRTTWKEMVGAEFKMPAFGGFGGGGKGKFKKKDFNQ